MQILMLSSHYSPDAKQTESQLPWKLAAQFVKSGHNVRMIVPGKGDLSNAEPALALRLHPVEITDCGSALSYTRFDTRTTGGIDVFVLKPKNETDAAYRASALGKAAAELVASSDFSPELLISWDGAFTVEDGLSQIPQKVAAISGMPPENTNGYDRFDKIIIHGQTLAQEIVSTPTSALNHIVSRGRAAIVEISSDSPKMTIHHKESAKATLQQAVGLPVHPRVPLIYIAKNCAEGISEALKHILTQQVQVICTGDLNDPNIKSLADTYPDRISFLPASANDASLVGGADFCVLDNVPESITAALCAGTVPLVATDAPTPFVELDPAMKSGTGMAFSPNAQAAEAALRQAIGMYSQKTRFDVLRGRLARGVVSMETAAAAYLPATE
ncbi:MAG: hypothetical protein JXX29_02105 [Deltaproteobacteria bacterium]|nr:hypothetical protein [Deltaproteobacteria bacterium]MBN2670435.1 hypothetical protein [Deltaproteobacteria bacterium]